MMNASQSEQASSFEDLQSKKRQQESFSQKVIQIDDEGSSMQDDGNSQNKKRNDLDKKSQDVLKLGYSQISIFNKNITDGNSFRGSVNIVTDGVSYLEEKHDDNRDDCQESNFKESQNRSSRKKYNRRVRKVNSPSKKSKGTQLSDTGSYKQLYSQKAMFLNKSKEKSLTRNESQSVIQSGRQVKKIDFLKHTSTLRQKLKPFEKQINQIYKRGHTKVVFEGDNHANSTFDKELRGARFAVGQQSIMKAASIKSFGCPPSILTVTSVPRSPIRNSPRHLSTSPEHRNTANHVSNKRNPSSHDNSSQKQSSVMVNTTIQILNQQNPDNKSPSQPQKNQNAQQNKVSTSSNDQSFSKQILMKKRDKILKQPVNQETNSKHSSTPKVTLDSPTRNRDDDQQHDPSSRGSLVEGPVIGVAALGEASPSLPQQAVQKPVNPFTRKLEKQVRPLDTQKLSLQKTYSTPQPSMSRQEQIQNKNAVPNPFRGKQSMLQQNLKFPTS